MQKATKFFSATLIGFVAFSLAPSFANAQTSSAKDSIVTVEQLLKIDNAQARANAAKELASSGLVTSTPVDPSKKGANSKPADVRASLSVSKIVGIGSNLRADLRYNGQTLNAVAVGSTVGPCNVTSIAGQCVALSVKPLLSDHGPSTSGKGSSSRLSKPAKPTSPLLCPTACWTGATAFETAPNVGTPTAQGSVSQAISGAVLPPGGVPGQTSMHVYAPTSPK